ncbi:MAG: glycosyltransferase family 39 protein [candidate division KSB1 bacterium]|nr:glycosyltransferase family 39 protein [candidate division KSB1 bacterium]
MTQNRFAAFVLLALILALALRLPHIEGDPPAGDISRSASFLADEGIHGYNALHWAITGDWYIADGFNPGVNTPVFMLFEYALLRTFGVHLKTVRYGAVACGLLSLVLLARLLRRLSRRAALMGGFLWAMAFPLVIYNRLAFIENVLLVFMLLLALLFVAFLERPQRLWPAVAGVAVFMAGWLTKPTLIFLLPAFGATLLYVRPTHHRRATGLALLTAIVLVAALYFFWVRPYADDWAYYQSIHMAERMPQSLGEILLNYARYFGHLKLFEFMPLIYGLALVQFLGLAPAFLKREEQRPVVVLLVFWLVFGVGFLGFFAYSPPRYSLLLLPAVIGLAAMALDQWLVGDRPVRLTGWMKAAYIALVLLQVAFGLYRYFAQGQAYPSTALPALALLILPLWARQGGLWRYALPVLIVLVQLGQTVRYYVSMEFSLRDGMQKVAKFIHEQGRGPDSVLAGDSAMLFAFEARVRSIAVMYREDRLPVLFRRWRSDFLLLEDPAELPRLQRLMPEYLRRLQPLAQFPLMNNYVHGRDAVLYRILPPKQD